MTITRFFERMAVVDLNQLIEQLTEAGAKVKIQEVHLHQTKVKYYEEYWGYLTLEDDEVL